MSAALSVIPAPLSILDTDLYKVCYLLLSSADKSCSWTRLLHPHLDSTHHHPMYS